MLTAQHREHQIPPRVEVVRRQQDLTESRLSEILGEQLQILAREIRSSRDRDRCRTANQVPELSDAAVDQTRDGERPAENPSDEAVLRSTRSAAAPETRNGAQGRNDHCDENRQQGETRNKGWQDRRREQRFHPSAVSGAQLAARTVEPDEREQERDYRGNHREREQRQWDGDDRRRDDERPTGAPKGRPPIVEIPDRRRSPEAGLLPQSRAAVDRREHRAEHANAAAGDQVDADAGLMQGAEHTGVIRATGAGTGEYQRRAQPCRVQSVGRIGCDHAPAFIRGGW
jgi:hypothetical protein